MDGRVGKWCRDMAASQPTMPCCSNAFLISSLHLKEVVGASPPLQLDSPVTITATNQGAAAAFCPYLHNISTSFFHRPYAFLHSMIWHGVSISSPQFFGHAAVCHNPLSCMTHPTGRRSIANLLPHC
eukprot:8374936-Ditylum_brightwellii.AAC.1